MGGLILSLVKWLDLKNYLLPPSKPHNSTALLLGLRIKVTAQVPHVTDVRNNESELILPQKANLSANMICRSVCYISIGNHIHLFWGINYKSTYIFI